MAIFDALDAGDRDAVAHEVQDSCNATLEYPYTLGCFHGTPRYTLG